jgi:RHH-type proline utilization regulon transcriptional repressor/proline dehydrogenase/delta 1-pyrroline-5-carboxylate dehydrogenase
VSETPRAGDAALEKALYEIGGQIVGAMPARSLHPIRRLEQRVMTRVAEERGLRASVFRFVDVAPACRSREDLARHLIEHVEQLERPPAPLGAAAILGRTKLGRQAVGVLAAAAVRRVAHRFVAGTTPGRALGLLAGLWKQGTAASLDLLGEATLTRAEAESYGTRCAEALETLSEGASRWPQQSGLEADSTGPVPRVNLSVKLTGLTPLMPPEAPDLSYGEAGPPLRTLFRLARDLDAHLHIDMESFDTTETTLGLVLDLLAEEEFRQGPSAGLVVQAYLRDSPDELDRVIRWAREQRLARPLVVRLVKGAYWDQEVALAGRNGWTPPVFTSKAECDRNFERLTRALLDARPVLRAAIASHNVRSVAHAIAYNRALGASDRDLELQVLYGLGDDLRVALVKLGFRVRVYCPVGDLLEGMAYLVRRLLENTSNESFLYRRAAGTPLEQLLAAPSQ